ncbi:hypothetical protein C8R43DRAFT_1136912 [Mycena crocata]|nr:hypothetical protein C8R43DRAFT_1136912 [Mycena crocata]
MSYVEPIITPSHFGARIFVTRTTPDPEAGIFVTTTTTTVPDPQARILVTTTTTIAPCDMPPEDLELESKLPNPGELLCRVAHAAADVLEVRRRPGTLTRRPMCPLINESLLILRLQ